MRRPALTRSAERTRRYRDRRRRSVRLVTLELTPETVNGLFLRGYLGSEDATDEQLGEARFTFFQKRSGPMKKSVTLSRNLRPARVWSAPSQFARTGRGLKCTHENAMNSSRDRTRNRARPRAALPVPPPAQPVLVLSRSPLDMPAGGPPSRSGR